MTSEEQDELKDAAIAMLVKVACRTSASYEYEIDTLRVALRRLLNAEYDDNGMDYCDWTPEMKAALNEWHAAREYARAAIDRTDWRTE
jgi:hypothetical protein